MVTVKILLILIVCIIKQNVNALSFPGPRVYVVTPSPRPFQVDNANSAPFYYHSWMRRIDSEESNATSTTTTTTTTPKGETPDLIFAEFESDGSMKKSIRKLLEKERIVPTTSTTSQPIYVPDEDSNKVTRIVNYGLPVSTFEEESETPEKYDASNFFMNKNLYNDASDPVYLPTTKKPATVTTTTSTTTTTTTSSPVNVENIWHIIDNEKFNQHSGNWDEVSIDSYNKETKPENSDGMIEQENDDTNMDNDDEEVKIDDNFALPGFGTNPGSGAENESRAIRTEPNIRFPYVNLKPFQMKTLKKPMLDVLNSKKGNNLYTNLDNFFDLKSPVRGEAQDVGAISMNQPVANNQPIDRYNPAQPYLPQAYGSKASKPVPPVYSPPKASANLVPPPPPPPPKGNDFPAPISYESFPPYAPSGSNFVAPSSPAMAPVLPPAPMPSPTVDTPPSDTSIDSYSEPSSDDGPPMDLGYRYKPPAPSSPPFLPTVAPASKPFKGYSYDKPAMPSNNAMADMPDFQGYDYSKPSSGPRVPDHPSATYDFPPSYGSSDSGPSYGHVDAPPEHHDSDYPEFVFNKHHGHMGDASGSDMKGVDAGMMPPPDVKPESYGPPPDDHGFPSDFPGDLKFNLDFDDHDHHHHYHTTTTTTEMPRVNRFSYYYLGKKLYYLPLYFSVYFIVYVGALIIKAVLRHKIVYPNSWRPNTTTASFFSKRSVDEFLSNENLHEMTGKVTHAIATAAEKYMNNKKKFK